jgi:peptidoglycan/LPS O-acetylase OafA/YrhL
VADSARSASFRADIEGLRAVAVLLVVADHLFGRPAGGFVGVDVFFVISGFLITGLLVGERDSSGTVSIRGFYARRARRILPASLVTLTTVWFVAHAVQLADQAHRTAVDVVWSGLGLANVHFAQLSTDYFAANTGHSPVQHYWSLAVEEQFYLLWPLLIIVVPMAARRFARISARRSLAIVLLLGLVASFWYGVVLTRTDVQAAYFSTPARAWELGAGALLAVGAQRLARLPGLARLVATATGLLLIGVAAVVDGASTPFPAPGAALPVLGATLVIVGGMAGSTRAAWPLTLAPMRYVGRISYSLYLWHWPVIILLPAFIPATAPSYDLVAVAAMATLSIASYHLVEAPFHRGLRAPLWTRGWQFERSALRPAFAGVAGAAIVVVGVAMHPAAKLPRIVAPAHVPMAGALNPGSQLSEAISDALAATSWPQLQPDLGHASPDRAPEWHACSKVNTADDAACTFPATGSAPTNDAVVIGDSIAVSWLPTIRAALNPNGYTVHGLTMMECGVAAVATHASGSTSAAWTRSCEHHRTAAVAAVHTLQPDLIVLSSAETGLARLVDGKTGAAAAAEWAAGMRTTLAALRGAAPRARVIVLAPPPAAGNVNVCVTPMAGPRSCDAAIQPDWLLQSTVERTAAKAQGAIYVDDHLLFCSAHGLCPPFIGGYTVRCDGIHLTETWARQLTSPLRPTLLGTSSA